MFLFCPTLRYFLLKDEIFVYWNLRRENIIKLYNTFSSQKDYSRPPAIFDSSASFPSHWILGTPSTSQVVTPGTITDRASLRTCLIRLIDQRSTSNSILRSRHFSLSLWAFLSSALGFEICFRRRINFVRRVCFACGAEGIYEICVSGKVFMGCILNGCFEVCVFIINLN